IAALPSWRKRCLYSSSSTNAAFKTLTATVAPSLSRAARKTSPMPPSPSGSSRRYPPSTSPAASSRRSAGSCQAMGLAYCPCCGAARQAHIKKHRSRHRNASPVVSGGLFGQEGDIQAQNGQGERARFGSTRLIAGYAVVIGFLVAAIAISITAGHDEHAAPNIAGFYTSSTPCLGKSFKLVQSGQFVDESGGV